MNYDKLVLGANAIYSMKSQETQLNSNVIVFGGSGSGKTTSIIEPCLLETHNNSLIVSVSKNKLYAKYAEMFKQRGYIVKHINFSNVLDSTDFYNPLAYIRTYGDIKNLAESIVAMQEKSSNSSADPYWDMISISLLSAEIGYCLATIRHPSFVDVLNLHDSLIIHENDYIITTSLDDKFDTLSEDHFAVKCWRSFRELPIRTAGSAFSSLNVLLDTLFTPELRKIMRNKKSIDITELAREKTVLFITTSPVSKSLHGLANLFIGQAIKDLFEYAEEQPTASLAIPVQLICDDFACGAKIANFERYISIFREKNIGCTLLLQSESQLADMYGNRGSVTIIDNCDTIVFLGGMDLLTAKHVSERANVPLEDILQLPIGTEYVFRRGSKPLKTCRYPITECELYRQITEEFVAKTVSAPQRQTPRSKTDFYITSRSRIYRTRDDVDSELSRKFDELFGSIAE